MWKIYCYQNKINGKRYIGVTNKSQIQRAGKNGRGYYKTNSLFGKAILEYGWDNFEYSILEETEDEFEASKLEKYYIELFNTTDSNFGYNMNKGGCVPTVKSIIQYDKNGNKIAKYKSVKEAEEITGISDSLIIDACNCKNKTAGGFVWRYEGREENLDTFHITPFSGERRVTQKDLSGKVITVFDSAKEAELKTGASRSKICMCCKGLRKTAGGYRWEYTDGFGLKDIYNPKPSKIKRVGQFDLSDNLIDEFSSISDAHRRTNISASMISQCCRGKRKIACGYIWKFL